MVAITVFAAGKWFNSPNEIAASVAALYSTLVYFQLREMRLQREDQLRIREEDRQAELERQPSLQFCRSASLPKAKIETLLGTVQGFGYYLNLPVTNEGETLATKCQPF